MILKKITGKRADFKQAMKYETKIFRLAVFKYFSFHSAKLTHFKREVHISSGVACLFSFLKDLVLFTRVC